MAEANDKPPVVLADTNVIIAGIIAMASDLDTPEARIWSAYLQGKLKLVFSEALLLEVVAVSRRLVNKDFASKLRFQVLKRSRVTPNSKLAPYVTRFMKKVPVEDVVHAALASATGASYVISNNRKFLRSLGVESGFKCVTPKFFVEAFRL